MTQETCTYRGQMCTFSSLSSLNVYRVDSVSVSLAVMREISKLDTILLGRQW